MPRHLSEHRCRIWQPRGAAAMQEDFGEVGVPAELGIPLLQPSIPRGRGQGWGQAGMRRVLGAGRARGRSPGSIATGTRHVMESFPPACFAWP